MEAGTDGPLRDKIRKPGLPRLPPATVEHVVALTLAGPPGGSWVNAVETLFPTPTPRRLQRDAFHSLVDLQAAINRSLDEHNGSPRPFV